MTPVTHSPAQSVSQVVPSYFNSSLPSFLPSNRLRLLPLRRGHGARKKGGNVHKKGLPKPRVPTPRAPLFITFIRNLFNVFPLISGGKVALNCLRPLPRFNATFPPILREKRYIEVIFYQVWIMIRLSRTNSMLGKWEGRVLTLSPSAVGQPCRLP